MVTCLEPGANANDAAFLSVCIHDLSADFGSGALDNRLRPDVYIHQTNLYTPIMSPLYLRQTVDGNSTACMQSALI